MATYTKSLAEGLKEFFKDVDSNEKKYSSVGSVITVNESEKTCSVNIGDTTITEVRLQQVSSTTGILIVPTVNSSVIISWTDNTTAYIAMYSEIDNILYQDGTNGGLINIVDITTKLNDLVGKVNNLYSLLQNWKPTPNDGGLALNVAANLLLSASLFDKSDYENTKFKH